MDVLRFLGEAGSLFITIVLFLVLVIVSSIAVYGVIWIVRNYFSNIEAATEDYEKIVSNFNTVLAELENSTAALRAYNTNHAGDLVKIPQEVLSMLLDDREMLKSAVKDIRRFSKYWGPTIDRVPGLFDNSQYLNAAKAVLDNSAMELKSLNTLLTPDEVKKFQSDSQIQKAIK